MILTHLESKDGKTLVRLPDGSTRWCDVHELIELAKSDLAERFKKSEEDFIIDASKSIADRFTEPKRKYNRKQK